MKQKLAIVLTPFLILILFACNQRSGKPRVLVFTKTAGYHHSSIPVGVAAIQKLGSENGFDVDTTSDAAMFTDDTLKKYSALIFLSTTGPLFNTNQEISLQRYIEAGGGFMGIHAATDALYDWGWYNRLVGGVFDSHPEQQEAKLIINDRDHISTKHLPAEWTRKDEWYNFKKLNPDVHVLISIDEKSYKGGNNGDHHPMAWFHQYDGGRAFYTELGHTEEAYSDPLYLKHILGGIKYAIDDNKILDYSKSKTQYPPDEARFTKVVLAEGDFFEPTEMTILPNLDVLIAQRRGELLLYKNESKKVKQAGILNVYFKTDVPGVNAEEGVLGLAKDPHFERNHYVYIYYSPADTSVNRLSRFKLENDSIDPNSEKVILQVYSQRNICCHTGGSIAFGPDSLLYFSAGDNSTPFDEPNQLYVSHGYAPLDDRPGHIQYDARRSAGNTNDLRGKINRIRVKEDGTYEIPRGNLFPRDEKGTRPEIYVMGNRNPYRITVDQKTGFLYWGEVGPDANADSLDTRGPRGYDEVNQARKAGYFGWPLFVGNNYPYHEYNYGTGASGPAFDPAKPMNESRNNTGLKLLPPAQPAFIWYPYGESKDFPQVGTGGRNAMAGPVYYADMYPAATRLPDYYNGKLITYDWVRGWMKAITMFPNGDYDRMEPFMEHTKLNSAIDMELGPDGRIYILEYGTGWFSKNADAALSRIDYNGGNLAPRLGKLQVDKITGPLPLKVHASLEASDPEKDPMQFAWTSGNGPSIQTQTGETDITFNKAGDYSIVADVKDNKGGQTKTEAINIYAGNTQPAVSVNVKGNQTFFFPNKAVLYEVQVADPEDGSVIDASNLYVSADYVQGSDRAGTPMGHQTAATIVSGKTIMLSLDCKTCHKVEEKSIGPAFTQVAQRYQKDPNAANYLINKIKKGGGGVWGETAMAAHPNLADADARQIVQWIMSLGGKTALKKSLPSKGSVTPSPKAKEDEILFINASYTDKGGLNIKPLTGNGAFALRNSKMHFNDVKRMKGFSGIDFNGMRFMITPAGDGWFSIDSVDLQGINAASVMVGYQEAPKFGFVFELRLDAPDGKKLGELVMNPPANASAKKVSMSMLQASLTPVSDGRLHDLYIVSKPKDPKESTQVGLGSLQFSAK